MSYLSFQDALSSIIVARDGFGDMAVSNAIGSNVFDINLGIGLPFVIRIIIDNFKPIQLLTPKEEVRFIAGSHLITSYFSHLCVEANWSKTRHVFHLCPEMNANIFSEYFMSYWAFRHFHILHI